MNARLPSGSVIHGLCAAFFLSAALNCGGYLVTPFAVSTYNLSRPAGWLGVVLVSLLCIVVNVLISVRLVYLRPHSVLHNLVLGWIILTWRVYYISLITYHNAQLTVKMHPSEWPQFFLSTTTSILIPAAVVWLLHVLLARQLRDAEPILRRVQIA